MRFRIGTSGFAYAPWKGRFYPKDIRDAAMLGFYASRLDTVEINHTFYRMPTPKLVAGWTKEVPEGFTFALKAPRYMVPTTKPFAFGDPIAGFFDVTAALGDRRGPTLVTLPPMKDKNVELFAAFLDRLPREHRIAVEARHSMWHDDDVLDVLRAREVALCISEGEDFATPVVRTGRFIYARLRLVEYTTRALERWAKRIASLGGDEAFVYFKHEDEGTGPRLAEAFRRIVEAGGRSTDCRRRPKTA